MISPSFTSTGTGFRLDLPAGPPVQGAAVEREAGAVKRTDKELVFADQGAPRRQA